ncbi:MAG: 2-C-methyl-D-erythritol 2,4-cyclodiphosphate synthase [Nitriliruptorales bacterium]|nr:2-C-methyl-D-erythritol 2,4-cyclodiphosphate synthase [Nitriliruptorales bacterium]
MRVGQGIDVHVFSDDPDRPLVLGGVIVPEGPGLAGHSDADVLLHALTDALLGAAALGDLGTVFGSDDPRYAQAPSSVFVGEALRRAGQAGWRLVNADCTIVAQRPRLAAHRVYIADGLHRVLGVTPGTVSVKSTSTDGLGMIGRGEGIACLAVALLERVPAG